MMANFCYRKESFSKLYSHQYHELRTPKVSGLTKILLDAPIKVLEPVKYLVINVGVTAS